MDSYRGKFLIASPKLRDPNFAQTVLLMIRHDDEGAFGLVLNRPLALSVKDAVQDTDLTIESDLPLYRGGPCDGPLMVLHDNEDVASEEVLPGVRFTTSAQHILAAMNSIGNTRCFAGYAGWTAGQLESEMLEDAWLVLPASPDQVFSDEVNLWQELLTRQTLSQWVDPDSIPDTPGTN